MPPPISSTSPLAPAISFLLISARPASSLLLLKRSSVNAKNLLRRPIGDSSIDAPNYAAPNAIAWGSCLIFRRTRGVLGDQSVLDPELLVRTRLAVPVYAYWLQRHCADLDDQGRSGFTGSQTTKYGRNGG